MRKVTIDVDHLLERGLIDKRIADVLVGHGQAFTLNAGIQFGLGICMIAFVAGAIALDPKFQFVPLWALALAGVGVVGTYFASAQFRMLAQTATVIGTLALCGWVWFMFGEGFGRYSERVSAGRDAVQTAWVLIAIICFGVGFAARNVLLAAIAVIATTPLVNMGTHYSHASYALVVERPLLTAITYAALAALACYVALSTRDWVQRIAWAIFAVALFITNEAFWVGSLWGDPDIARMVTGANEDTRSWNWDGHKDIARAFAHGWGALSLLSACVGYFADKRSVVNLGCTFLAINLYTQWFERLIMNPKELLVAAVAGIVALLALWHYNNAPAKVAVAR